MLRQSRQRLQHPATRTRTSDPSKYDRRQRDRYGRLLAYVYRKRDGLFVPSAELVRKGYAREMRVPPNVAQASRISRIERRARSSRRRLSERLSDELPLQAFREL